MSRWREPARARLRAEARVINRGKRVGYLECDVTDQDGKLVAKANSTCFVLRGGGRTRAVMRAPKRDESRRSMANQTDGVSGEGTGTTSPG